MSRGASLGPLVLAAAMLVALGAAAAPSNAATTDHGLSHYDSTPVSFFYPSSWHVHNYPDDESTFSAPLAFLSNQSLHNPCTIHKTPRGTETNCSLPVDKLNPNGILVEWAANSLPIWTFASAPGTPLTVDGLPAKIQMTPPDLWTNIGCQRSLNVIIEEAPQVHSYELTACMRGPAYTAHASEVMAMLRSTKFSTRTLRAGEGTLTGTAGPCTATAQTLSAPQTWDVSVYLYSGTRLLASQTVIDSTSEAEQPFSFVEPAGTYSVSSSAETRRQTVVINPGKRTKVSLVSHCV